MLFRSGSKDHETLPVRHIGAVLGFSCVINILYLTGPMFMMQVYDRVLPSGSLPTLVGLFAIAALLFLLFGILDYMRTQITLAEGEAFAERMSPTAFRAALGGYAHDDPSSIRRTAVDDLNQVRNFLTSPGATALVDLAFMPVFLLFIFGLHAVLGVTSILAAAVLIGLTLLNERIGKSGVKSFEKLRVKAHDWTRQVLRQASFVLAGGMDRTMTRIWVEREQASRLSAAETATRSSLFTTITRTTRLFVQSLILAIGAYLVVRGELSAGAMIAASIVFARTLAPVEQILAHFTPLLRAMEAWSRIRVWRKGANEPEKLELPTPHKELKVRIASLCPPESTNRVLEHVACDVSAGQVVAVIGPSGSGKSSLTRALAVAWRTQPGSLSLDGASFQDWRADQLSQAIGYMPQESELFDGTIAQNISRFEEDTDSEKVIEACTKAGAHKLVLGLAEGYNTPVGASGTPLSAGQRQRICLARALYKNPFIVILDEPNSNLDEQGEAALSAAIRRLKDENHIVILVAHRQKALRDATHLCIIEDGRMKMYGPKGAVEQRLALPPQSGSPTDKPASDGERASA